MTRDDILKIFMANTMGESILIETLRSAAYFASRSSNGYAPRYYRERNLMIEAHQCYLFVQGTGLDILIHSYNLDYDPVSLRNSFNQHLRHAS